MNGYQQDNAFAYSLRCAKCRGEEPHTQQEHDILRGAAATVVEEEDLLGPIRDAAMEDLSFLLKLSLFAQKINLPVDRRDEFIEFAANVHAEGYVEGARDASTVSKMLVEAMSDDMLRICTGQHGIKLVN